MVLKSACALAVCLTCDKYCAWAAGTLPHYLTMLCNMRTVYSKPWIYYRYQVFAVLEETTNGITSLNIYAQPAEMAQYTLFNK